MSVLSPGAGTEIPASICHGVHGGPRLDKEASGFDLAKEKALKKQWCSLQKLLQEEGDEEFTLKWDRETILAQMSVPFSTSTFLREENGAFSAELRRRAQSVHEMLDQEAADGGSEAYVNVI